MNKKLVQGVGIGLVAGAVAGVLVAKNAGSTVDTDALGLNATTGQSQTADIGTNSVLPADEGSPGDFPEVLKGSEIEPDQVIADFATPVPALRGYLFQRDERSVPMAVYVAEGGEYMVAGAMVDKNGDSVTSRHYKQHSGYTTDELRQLAQANAQGDGKQRQPKGAEEILAGLQDTTLVTQGDGPAEMYVLMDVDCPYCKRLYNTVSSLHDKVTVHWVMVGYRGPAAQETAAKILGSEEPAEALDRVLDDRRALADYDGPTKPEAVSANTRTAQRLGIRGTPHGVAVPADGEVQRIRGAVPKERLSALLGL